jgi:hypothetical protein
MTQLPLCVSVAGQLFVCKKSVAFVPVMLIPEIVKEALPVFVTVTLCTALVVPIVWAVKFKLEGEREIWPESPEPVIVAV